MKKTLPIIIDDNKIYSNELKKMFIYHKYHDINLSDNFINNQLTGINKFINKIFITSNLNILNQLIYIFNQNNQNNQNNYGSIELVFLTDSYDLIHETIYPFTIMTSLCDFVEEFTIMKDYQFYTNREINRLNTTEYVNINLSIIIIYPNNKNNIKAFLGELVDINPLENQYLINSIDIYNITDTEYDHKEYNIQSDDTIINISSIIMDSDDQCMIDNMILQLQDSVFPIIDYDSIKFFKLLYKYSETEKINVSDIIIIFNEKEFGDSLEDLKIQNLINEIVKKMNNKKNKNKNKNDTEYIYLYGNIFAIGTRKIMTYYTLLYQYFGTYYFWTNNRKFISNGIWNDSVYYAKNKYLLYDPKIQLVEHILHFSDCIFTEINQIHLEREYVNKLYLITNNNEYIHKIAEIMSSIFTNLNYDVFIFPNISNIYSVNYKNIFIWFDYDAFLTDYNDLILVDPKKLYSKTVLINLLSPNFDNDNMLDFIYSYNPLYELYLSQNNTYISDKLDILLCIGKNSDINLFDDNFLYTIIVEFNSLYSFGIYTTVYFQNIILEKMSLINYQKHINIYTEHDTDLIKNSKLCIGFTIYDCVNIIKNNGLMAHFINDNIQKSIIYNNNTSIRLSQNTRKIIKQVSVIMDNIENYDKIKQNSNIIAEQFSWEYFTIKMHNLINQLSV